MMKAFGPPAKFFLMLEANYRMDLAMGRKDDSERAPREPGWDVE